MKEIELSFGGQKSPPDYRDIGLAQVIGEPGVYPSKFFVGITKLPVWHQRKIGACVGHAFAKYKQKLDLDDTGVLIDLSARFAYAMAKILDGFSAEGTYPRLVAKIFKDYGCATEKTVPNDTTLDHETYVFNRKIGNVPESVINDAKLGKIAGYAFVDVKNKDALKQAIVEAGGCALLMRVGNEWFTDKSGNSTWSKSKILPLRPPKSIISGHEVYLYGYEDVGEDTKFYILNSWSKEWADKGTGWFWYSQYRPYIDEAITVADIPNELLEEAHNLPDQFTYTFNKQISFGQRNAEVKALQRALKVEGLFTTDVTGYYGTITQKAVLAFQFKHSVAPQAELLALNGRNVGPKTLAKLNELYSK